jgi:1-acyl-sn-glycerol-3-phosphate acyltransferase
VWRTTVVGADRVPRTGPVIVMPNHLGAVDGPLVHGAVPRGSHILIKESIFRSKVGWLMRLAQQIPVDRSNGRAALAMALGVLRRGDVVGIFPEGTRGNGDGSGARAGAAWLAVTSGAPVVPVAVLGSRRDGDSRGYVPRFRARMHLEFGEPIVVPVPPGVSRSAAIGAAAELLRDALMAHVADVSARTGILLPTRGPDDGLPDD